MSITMTDLLERARTHRTPLIEDGAATFVWEGDRAPELIGDMTGWSLLDPERPGQRFEPAGPGVWTLTIRPEPDAYLEYALRIDGERRLDPLNPRQTPNGFGDTNNYFHMPEAPRSGLFRRRPGVPRGRLTQRMLRSRHLIGGRRKTWLYRPAAAGPTPLLVVMDGADYVGRVQMPALLDNLIAAGQIAPLTAVFVDNAGPDRVVEYTSSEGLTDFAAFLTEDLLPRLADQVELATEPGSHGVLGASASGLAALWLGIRFPEVFGRVFSQAGGFAVGLSGDQELTEEIRSGERKPIRVYLDCGTYDFLYQGNRAMRRLLEERGYPVTYREFHAGHNYPAWREDLAAGLSCLFPPARPATAR